MRHDGVTCRELVEFLCDYVDGTLPAAERERFLVHLRLCPPCVTYLRSYEATIRLGKAAMKEPGTHPLPPMPEELVQAILKARPKKQG